MRNRNHGGGRLATAAGFFAPPAKRRLRNGTEGPSAKVEPGFCPEPGGRSKRRYRNPADRSQILPPGAAHKPLKPTCARRPVVRRSLGLTAVSAQSQAFPPEWPCAIRDTAGGRGARHVAKVVSAIA